MLRTNTIARPSHLAIRLTGLAGVTILALGGLMACGSGDEPTTETRGTVATPIIEPPAVVDVGSVEPTGFVVPEGVTYAMAESVFAAKRYSEATEMFRVVSEGTPENPWTHYMLGLSAWKAGEPELAERAFVAALELDPHHLKSELNLTRVLLEVGRYDVALAHAERGLAIDSTSAEAWRLLGRVQGSLRNVEPALVAYRKAIALDDQDVWSMNNMGLLLIEAGRFQEALGPLARATEIRTNAPVFQNNLGMALERTGHYNAAATAYGAAVSVDSSYTRAIISLGRVRTLKEASDLTVVDLPALARTFALEIQAAGGTVVMVPPPPQK